VFKYTPKKEDAHVASPVEVANPSPEYDVSTETPQIKEPPAAEEVLINTPTERFLAEDYSVTKEPLPIEECPVAEELLPSEECPVAEELSPAKEPPATEEVPAEYSPIEEIKADPEPEAVEQPGVPTGSNVEDTDGDGAERPKEQAGEVVLICTSCTTMLLIQYNVQCPYSINSLMGLRLRLQLLAPCTQPASMCE
jgi:hypothetical protein